MPTETGVVIRTGNGRVWIKTFKSSTCAACSSRESCGNPHGGKEMEVEAINDVNAKSGDRVMISFGTAPLMKVYSLVYIFPIVALLAGAIFGLKVAAWLSMDQSLASMLVGAVFFVGAFFAVRSMGARMAKKDIYQPRVLRILRPAAGGPK